MSDEYATPLPDSVVARIAALESDRQKSMRVLEKSTKGSTFLWKVAVPFTVLTLVLALNRDWTLAAVTAVVGVVCGVLGRRFVASSARVARRHIELVDREVVRLKSIPPAVEGMSEHATS